MSVVGTKYSALPNVHEEMSLDALLATGLDYLDISNKRGICFGD
jgi:saccharopine dehydrogenase-like NADP-dependent oxidoreductase